MINSYRNLPFYVHALIITACTFIGAAIGYQFSEALPSAAAGFGISTLIYLFFVQLRSFLTGIVIVVYLFIFGVIAYNLHINKELDAILPVSTTLLAIGVAGYAVATVTLYTYVATRYSRGASWLNLTVALVIATTLTMSTLPLNPLYFVLSFSGGLVAGLIYLWLRRPNLKKKPVALQPNIPSKLRKVVKRVFADEKLNYKQIPNTHIPGHFIAWNDHGIYLISVISSEIPLQPTKGQLLISKKPEVDYLPVIESMHAQVASWNKDLTASDVSVIVLDVSETAKQPVVTIRTSKWKQPEAWLPPTHILSKEGFKRFMRAMTGETAPLKPVSITKLKKLLQKLDTPQ